MSGAVTGKESKTPRQQSIIPANRRRRTNRCVLGCFARRRPCSPSLASWWPAGSESRSRATHHNHYKTSVPIYVQTGLVGLSAHKKLLDVSRRRDTKEWTPLQPGLSEKKYYVRGVGPLGNPADLGLLDVKHS